MTMPTKIIAPILLEDFRKVVTKRDKGIMRFFFISKILIWSDKAVDSIYSHSDNVVVFWTGRFRVLFDSIFA